MLLGVVMVGPVSAPSTTIGVEPWSIVDLGLGIGSTFTVEIWVRNVANLAGVEFKLGYDTTVLTATTITYGDIFGESYFPLISVIYDADGYLHYSAMQYFGEPGVGDGRAAIIDFTVDSLGGSALNLYDTKLGDNSSPPQPIVHTAIDGYFRNAPISVTLVKKSAWPEHHHYSIGKDEDSSNDLFAIVKNDGEVWTWVKAFFEVSDLVGNPMGESETAPVLLPAGAVARLNAAYVPPSVGKYYPTAQAWYDADGDTVPDTAMGKQKAFSFNVVP